MHNMEQEFEYRLKHSPVPALSSLLALPLYIIGVPLFFGGYAWYHIPLALGTGRLISKAVGLFCPVKRVKVTKKYIAPQSGIGDIDRQLREADRTLRDVEKYRDAVNPVNPKLSAVIGRIVSSGRKIMEYAAVNTVKTGDLRKFFTYYLPMLDKLLKNYILLENHAADGKNAVETKKEIEDALGGLEVTFDKLLDRLFDDTALDISTDIDVLENEMQDDIGGDIAEKLKKLGEDVGADNQNKDKEKNIK